jgi:MOSC domain-containing protein YiiM
MVTSEQGDLPKDTALMRTLVRETNYNLGSALSVLEPGEVSLGDSVELIRQH